jgi:hypothetical protein
MNNARISILVDGVLGLAIIVGGIVLLALGKIDQPTGIAVIGGGAAVAKGATSAALALQVPAPAQPTPPVTPSG